MTWTLASAEARAAANDSFEIPTRAEREALRIGDLAKLVFVNSRKDGERMWVKIETVLRLGAAAPRYCGRLQNMPVMIQNLQEDAVITFGPEQPLLLDSGR